MAFSTSANIGAGGLNSGTSKALDKFVPEVWADAIKDYFPKKLVFASLAMDWSAQVASGGDLIHFPKINEVSTGSKSAHSAISWATNSTDEGEYTMSIDQHSYANILIEDVVGAQSSYDLFSAYTSELAYGLAKKVETFVEDTMRTGANSTIELSGTTSSNGLAKADLETIMKTLLENDLDPTSGDVYLALKPEAYSSLFSLDDFARADVIGDSFNYPRVSGFIGQVMGLPVYVSNLIGTNDTGTQDTVGYLWHRSGVNVAYSINPRVQSDYDIDYLGSKVVTDAVYGGKIIGANSDSKRRVWRVINEA